MRIWSTLSMDSLTILRGEGCTVWDPEGNSYLDLLSGYWCNILGHNNPQLVDPVKRQLDKLVNIKSSFQTQEINDAIKKLETILPPELNRVAFLNSGSEAVDLSLKMARAATGKSGVIVHDIGYYGATSYTLALSGAGRNASYLQDPGEVHRIPAPNCKGCPHGSREPCDGFECLTSIKHLIDSGNTNIAAIIYEPILGAGILVPPVGYGAKLKEYAEQLDAFLIAEEVTTGMGKTGHWFAFQHDDFVPDILVLGKALGGGFPVSLVVTKEDVKVKSRGVLSHVQSHQNDALTGMVIKTMIEVIFRFFPPFVITYDEIDRFNKDFEDILS